MIPSLAEARQEWLNRGTIKERGARQELKMNDNGREGEATCDMRRAMCDSNAKVDCTVIGNVECSQSKNEKGDKLETHECPVPRPQHAPPSHCCIIGRQVTVMFRFMIGCTIVPDRNTVCRI